LWRRRSQLGFGTLGGHRGGRWFTLQLPLGAERGKEVIGLLGDLLVPSEGLAGQHGRTEVHEHRPRREDDVAVALAVHGGPVPLAQETRLAVTQVVVALHRAGRRAHRRADLLPPLQPLALLRLQLGLRGEASRLQHGLLPQVTGARRPDGLLLLLDLGEPGEELVGLALGDLGAGEPGVGGGVGLAGDRGGQDGHGGG